MTRVRFVPVLAVSAALQLYILSLPASAADLPDLPSIPDKPGISLKDTPPVFAPLWQGFYLGGHLGGAWSNTNLYDNFTYVGDPTYNGTLGGTGLIGGAQAGYNFQRGNFVFGLEGDIGYLGISANKRASFQEGSCSRTYDDGSTVSYTGQYCSVDAKYSSSGDLYGDLTGRLGYSMDRTLFYVKGGAAFLNADFKANYAGGNCTFDNGCGGNRDVPSTFNFAHSGVLAGWTIGAGAEYALTPTWSLKAEYQHFDFGSMSYSYSGCYIIPNAGGTCPGGHYTSIINGKTDVSITADAVTLGVNYHFNDEAGLQ